jgi:hypothetical protein
LAGLLIEAIRLVEKLAAMVSPLLTTAGCCRLGRLTRIDRMDRNGRDGARKSKGCQWFLGVRRSDQAADTKKRERSVTIARMPTAFRKPPKRETYLRDQFRQSKG